MAVQVLRFVIDADNIAKFAAHGLSDEQVVQVWMRTL